MASLARRAKKLATGDVVFVMDCTGSMGSFIAAARNECCKIIDSVKAEGGAVSSVAGSKLATGTKIPLRVRFGFVAYRDYMDGAGHLQHCDFTEDVDSVKGFIGGLSATGGGDGPEDVVGGLRVAAETLTWTAQHRTVFLFADAPNHGHLLHDGSGDSYARDPRTLQAEADIPRIMANFRSTNTDFFFVRINPTYTQKMEGQLKTFYEQGRETGAAFTTFDLNSTAANFFEEVGKYAVGSVSRSMTASMTSSRRGFRALAGEPPRDLDESKPIWPVHLDPSAASWALPDGWKEVPAEMSFCFMARHTDAPKWKSRNARLVQRVRPFAYGAMRAAYYFYNPATGEKFVGKRYLGKGATPKDYESDIYMQHYAQCLAKDANERLSKAKVRRAFAFLLPWKLKDPKSGLVFCMEYYMQGEYKKWNNNNGWSDDSMGGLMAAAFSHFSHAATAGQAMVVDIQGVNGWCFTDPQVHSADPKAFGAGNLGETGMTRFYATHQCNSYCKLLGCSPERRELQPIQEFRRVDVTGGGLKAFCSVCGSDDVLVKDTDMSVKARKRQDILCREHNSLYMKTLENCKCVGCGKNVEFSSWYVDIRGLAPPERCASCQHKAGGRATEARIIIHGESAPESRITFAASKGLSRTSSEGLRRPEETVPSSSESPSRASRAERGKVLSVPYDENWPDRLLEAVIFQPRAMVTDVNGKRLDAEGGAPGELVDTPSPMDFPLRVIYAKRSASTSTLGEPSKPSEVRPASAATKSTPPQVRSAKDSSASDDAQYCAENHVVPKGSKFCTECGGPPLPKASSATKCSSCGHSCESSSKFCGGCGNPLSVSFRCPNGHDNEANAKFCSECGLKCSAVKPLSSKGSSSEGSTPATSSRSSTVYNSRREYLASEDGLQCLSAFVRRGNDPAAFKRKNCRNFKSGTCSFGKDCSFVHDEFPM
eukprot:Skav234891  [mRNA]  locus=scaffold840:580054:586168:- [translate_table: standard]